MILYHPDCGSLKPTYGVLNNTNTTYGTIVSVICNPGYEIEGAQVLTCTNDGTWSENTTCTIKGKI